MTRFHESPLESVVLRQLLRRRGHRFSAVKQRLAHDKATLYPFFECAPTRVGRGQLVDEFSERIDR